MSKKGDYPIPFDPEGNQQHYPECSWARGPDGDFERHSDGRAVRVEPEWRPNAPFSDTLTFNTYSRGRSAAYFHFKRTDGTGVCMFLTDMEEAIPHLMGGKLRGTFQFTKRGQNYGLKLIAPDNI